MNKVNKLGQVANFVFYLTLQVAVARFLVLGHTGFCFVYVGFLLLLPRAQHGLTTLLFIGFITGLLVDMIYQSVGLHAFASVLMVYLRASWLNLILPTSGYKAAMRPTPAQLGWKRFSFFAFSLIVIHHASLFFLDAGSFSLFFVAMQKLFLSALLTCLAVLVTQVPTLLSSK